MKRLALLAMGLALAAPVYAQKAPVPDLLKRALSMPASKALFAYDFETVSVNVDPKKGPLTTTTRGRIDPSRKKGDRVTITFAEGQTGDGKPINTKKMDENLEKAADGDIFCDTASRDNVTNVVDKGATANGHAFTFTPSAEADTDGEMKEIMKKMSADAVIDEITGLLKSFEGKLQKKHTVMFVAEVKSASMKMDCQPAPNGRAYAARTEFTGLISAFGNTFDTRSVQTISNITPVG